jgi:hypothetical protein
LIWAVRDPNLNNDGDEHGDRKGEDGDQGVMDKRLLVIETEFASTLRVAERNGNTLSPVVRQAWDRGDLRILTRNSPATATDAHISIIGHVTSEELLRYLTRTEKANGYANRFLWFAVQRSKFLPDGGSLADTQVKELADRVADALAVGRDVGEVRRDERASALWHEKYRELSGDRHGLFGAITSRAEAHVLRLSLLYAIADASQVIREEHLRAALAVWTRAQESVRTIFGETTGNPVADRIHVALLAAPNGLTRDEVGEIFDWNKPTAELEAALTLLARLGKALPRREATAAGGRPVERWRAVR